jgi:HEAT repeat protein
MLRRLAKAVKTHQLYLPNNPIYQRAIDNLRAAFEPIWREVDELVLHIAEGEFRWQGRVVLQETTRGESLPWVFYKDGVREVTLLRGIEKDEVVALLEILQRVRKASPDEDDLLTLLWEQEFACLRYRFIDIGPDAVAPIEPSEGAGTERRLTIVDGPEAAQSADQLAGAEGSQAARPGIVQLSDLDATLYFLDEREIEYLRAAVQSEQSMDLQRNVLAILLDIFEVQSSLGVREELCGILEGFMLHLLAAGRYGVVAYLLRETAGAISRLADLEPVLRARLLRLPESLSDPSVLSQLLQSLDESSLIPPQEELDALFEQLRPGTLGTVLGWLKQVQSAQLRTALEKAAARLASLNTAEMVKLILSEDSAVALEAIRRAGELKTAAAVASLARVMSSAAAELRLAAAVALAEIGSPGALRVLEQSLDDEDRDVRVTAVRAMGARNHRPALPKIEAVVRGRAVKGADLTEKMAYFEAFGALAGESGVSRLDSLLNARSFWLGRKRNPDIRACAAMALGKIKSSSALAALQRAAADKDVRVRSAINKVLRGGAE